MAWEMGWGMEFDDGFSQAFQALRLQLLHGNEKGVGSAERDDGLC